MTSTSPTRLPSLRRPVASSRPVSMFAGALADIPDLSAAPVDADASKKLKRRSLLSQIPWKIPTESKDINRIRGGGENGGIDTSRPSNETRSSADSSGRKTADGERTVMPATSPSKSSRPASMIPPRASSSKAAKARTRVSAVLKDTAETVETSRAHSLAALEGSAPATTSKPVNAEPGPQRAGSTKLPQVPRAAGPAIPSRTTSVRLKETRTRKGSNASGIQAAAVITISEEPTTPSKQRVNTVESPTANKTSQAKIVTPPRTSSAVHRTRETGQAPLKTSPPHASVLSRPRPTSMLAPPPSKPSFTTYQQHYSPAKSSLPKAPVPLSKAAPKPPPTTEEEVPIDFEVTKEQIELLQLSLLHQSSAKCMAEHTASAKRKLGKMHSKLRRDYENLRAMELVHQRVANLSALDTWCPDTGLLVENLQILSLVYSDLTSLMEEDSRHSDVVSMFELWMNEAEAPEPGTFIQPLPQDWKAAQASLALKLRSIQRNLRVLPRIQIPGGEISGVEVVLTACKMLVEDMLRELEVMVKLEKEVMLREKVRIEHQVDAMVMSDVVTDGKDGWVPGWRRVF